MDKKGWDVWNNITFKTQGYRKNFDLITENENIISEYIGAISMMRTSEHKPPFIIGEYSFSVWDISLAKILEINLNTLLIAHTMVSAYYEMAKVIKKEININDYDKIVLIHSLVVRPEYRKLEITEEFMEFIYRDYHANNTAIIALVQPFQDNEIDLDYYMNQKTVLVRNEFGATNKFEVIQASDYYSLIKFLEKDDSETNEYKLFALAQRCGFKRINDSHLFFLNPEIVIERIKEKKELQHKIDEEWEKR
jgi:hypothetical protein